MDSDIVQSNDLHNLNTQQSSEKATINCETSQMQPQSPANSSLQEELNRFKEIQKNPQLLLQTLMEMEYQKQQRIKQVKENDDMKNDDMENDDMENDETMNAVEKECKKQLFLCHICGSVLQRNSMYAHLKLHNGFKSDIENRYSIVSSKRNLRGHRIIHDRKRKSLSERSMCKIKLFFDSKIVKQFHICKVCTRTFLSELILLEHLMIHTGEKPFRCDTCYGRFRQKSVFSRHMKACSRAAISK